MPISQHQAEERALVLRLQSGEEDAFGELIREHGGRMLAVARRLLGNDDDAQEVVQEAFLSAFRGIASFQGEALLSTWLHRITVNASLMRRRTLSRRREENAETEIEKLLPKFTPGGHHAQPPRPWPESAEAALERRETCELVRACIEELPETYRLALILRDIEELETEEVARHLGVTTNAAKIRVHRGRQALRTLLDRRLGTASA